VNNEMNDFVRNMLQYKFYACYCILLSGTHRCTPTCSVTMLLMVQLVPKSRCC